MKMISQRTSFECGPVAIRNAMVLKGMKPIGVKRLRKMCRTDKNGTSMRSMFRVVKKLFKECHFCSPPTGLSALLNGYIVIVGYTVDREGHYCVLQKKGNRYVAYNWAPDDVIEYGSHTASRPVSYVSVSWLFSKMNRSDTEVYVL